MSRSFSGINPGDAKAGHGGEARRVSAQERRPKKTASSFDDAPFMPQAFDAPHVKHVKGEGFFARFAANMDMEEGLDHEYLH